MRQASIGAGLGRKPGQRTAEFTPRVKIQQPGSSPGFLLWSIEKSRAHNLAFYSVVFSRFSALVHE